MRRFELTLPDSLEACQRALADGPEVKLVAGGTDLLPQMKNALVKPRRVVDLSALPELKVVERGATGDLRVGSGASARRLELSQTVRERFAALAESAAVVGSYQVRNLATLGGNLANAAPSADMVPPLLALDAEAVIALEAETILESGAYSGALLTMSAVFLASVYQWPAFDVRGFEVLTHKPSVAAYRAPLAPQTAFASDSQMDTLARQLELDPAEYKTAYLQRGGDLMANGQEWAVNGAHECLEQLKQHPVWLERDAWRASGRRDGHGLRGTGISVGGWVPNIQPTSATVRLDSDGTVAVVTGSVDIAGTNMGLALIAAEA